MQRRTHILFASILLLVLAGWWFTGRDHSPAEPVVESNRAEGPAEVVSDAETRRQFEAIERDKLAQENELARRTAERDKRNRASAKTLEARKQIQYDRASAWSQVLAVNWPEYQKLRTAAAATPEGSHPCSICNGSGSMHECALCESSGKCPTCKNIPLSGGELCPSCLGTGKCYLCSGTGHMICPFCEDGMVDVKLPPPPNRVPIENISPAISSMKSGTAR